MQKNSFARVGRGIASVSALALLAILGTTRVARAQSASDSATPSHEKRAQVAYALQDWPATIREFEAAFQLEQKPDFLWGIAQAQRLSGDCKACTSSACVPFDDHQRIANLPANGELLPLPPASGQ